MQILRGIFLHGITAVVSEKCQLFNVECSLVAESFKIAVNNACRTAEYGHLPNDFSGVFAYAEADIDSVPVGLKSECRFNADGSAEFGFNTCGASVHTAPVFTGVPENDKLGYYTTYIHHLQEVGGIVTSQMDYNTAICKLDHAQVESGEESTILEPIDETPTLSIIYSSEIVKKFNFKMVLGANNGDNNFQILTKDDRVRVGSSLIIKLNFTTTDLSYVFAYHKCNASAAVESMPEPKVLRLYDDYCPNDDIVKALNLRRLSTTSFEIESFRILSSPSLTFACEVAVYPNKESMPQTCKDGVTNVDTASVSATTNVGSGRKKRSDENSRDVSVSFTINLEDDPATISSSPEMDRAGMAFVILFSVLV